jgi:hypothetical protein
MNTIVGDPLNTVYCGPRKNLSNRLMEREPFYKNIPEESTDTKYASSSEVGRFIFEILGRQLDDLVRSGRRSVPESFQSRGMELMEKFREEFFALLSENARSARLNSVQVEFLSKTLIQAVDMQCDTFKDEISLTKDVGMLLSAATYINSLHG